LRQDQQLAGMLLVALTGWGADEDRRRTQAAGFDAHLTKPVEPEHLLKTLSEPLPLRVGS
jgi:CheY-like chemotaxis protein